MDDYCTNNEEAISEFELYMLKTLNWQISPITVNSWLNIYLQIKKVNNHSNTILNTSFVLPPKELHVDYIKAIALVDLCIFDIECLKYKYSQLAACAMYHTIKPSDDALTASGYKLNDLQMCLSWMSTYADIIKENQDSIKLKKFNDVDPDDAHNIQLYFKYLEFLVCSISSLVS
jgi:cyclin E